MKNPLYLTSLLGCQMDILNLYECTQNHAPDLSSTNFFVRHHFRRWQLKFLVTQNRSPGVVFDFSISLNTTYIFLENPCLLNLQVQISPTFWNFTLVHITFVKDLNTLVHTSIKQKYSLNFFWKFKFLLNWIFNGIQFLPVLAQQSFQYT